MTKTRPCHAQSTRPVWHKTGSQPLGHASRYKSIQRRSQDSKDQPNKTEVEIVKPPAHEHPIDHLAPLSSGIPYTNNGTLLCTGRSGDIQFRIGLDQLFGKRCRGRAPVAHMLTDHRNGDGGRINRSERDKPGMIAELLRISFSGPVRKASVWAVPVFPAMVTRSDFARVPVPSLTTPASASLISGKIPGRRFNVRLGTTDRAGVPGRSIHHGPD